MDKGVESMAENKAKTNYWAIAGLILGAISTFIIEAPITPLLAAGALVISAAGIYEARKTEQGLAYAAVGFILGLFVLVYYFYAG
ncbi:hypothetical protein [Virgibacillus sp. YIM 98842]|jgi:hypothetical protein|uniref:hypothetical protein n=1 Tax=Virgibacillus sp. YIM 98842 TaxID=2663533 RepID=UPI0013DA0472|nr:hypothetical protein [Virgibacillus sp. YIM 98842]